MIVVVGNLMATAGNLKDNGTGWKHKIMITTKNIAVMVRNLDASNGYRFNGNGWKPER